MELHNSFTVPSDIERAWATLLDIENIAPCVPGATLTSVDGDDLTGSVKVKVGPVTMTYKGNATFLERNPDTHVAVIEGSGREARGTGTATGKAHVSLHEETATTTRVDVVTDLSITGKAAQFGRGMIEDVAGRIADQFAANVATLMAAATVADVTDSATSPDVSANGAASPAPAPRTVPPLHEAEPIDLLGTAGAPILKRLIPVLVGVLTLGLAWWFLSRRRGD